MLWKRQHMLTMPGCVVADYCKYSDYGFQKPTSFCSNCPLELKVCRKDSRCDHIMTPEEYLAMATAYPYYARKRKSGGVGTACHRNNKTVTFLPYAEFARVPEALIESIFQQIFPELLV
jgi:hypothetical protein